MPSLEWSESHEEILRKWKSQCFVDLWLQSEAAYFYSRVYNLLSYPVIVLTTFSSAALFGGSSTTGTSEVLQQIIGALTLISALLTTVTRQMKPAELSQQFSISAKRYLVLLRSLDTMLSQDRSLRPDPIAYVDKIRTEMDTLLGTQVEPPKYVKKRFERKFGSLDALLYGEDIVHMIENEMVAVASMRDKNSPFAREIQKKIDQSEIDEVAVAENAKRVKTPRPRSALRSEASVGGEIYEDALPSALRVEISSPR
jgi:hypothetical protein